MAAPLAYRVFILDREEPDLTSRFFDVRSFTQHLLGVAHPIADDLRDETTAILALKRIDTREASAALSTLQRELDASFEPYFRRGVTPDGTGERP